MTNEDKVLYLANVALISAVDGEVNPLEANAIENIRQEIGATEDNLRQALTAVAQGDHQLTPIGRYSERIRNLEDMIVVAIVDGGFTKAEKPEVLSFAKSLKITQEQISEILNESKTRIKSQTAGLECTACGKNIPADSKFCPKCGSKV